MKGTTAVQEIQLPLSKQSGPHDTLRITYKDGKVMSVPYIDHASALRFLSSDQSWSYFDVVPYDGH